MTRPRRRRLVVLSTGAALFLPAALLTGCSAGQLAATSREVSAVAGGSADVVVPPPADQKGAPGQRISIRNATVDYTPGGYQPGQDAPLTLWIFNGTRAPVTLTGVTSVRNGQVASCTQPAAPTPASATAASPETATPSGTASVTPSEPASAPPASPAPAPTAGAGVHVTVQPRQLIELSPGSPDGCLRLTGLTAPVSAGKTVGLVFSFLAQQDGRTYTIGTREDPFEVPVGLPATARPRMSISLATTPPVD